MITALRTSAFRPSATVLQASTRCTMSCSAPYDDITITVPPMIPIQRLNPPSEASAQENFVFNQTSLPSWPAREKTSGKPPSNCCGI